MAKLESVKNYEKKLKNMIVNRRGEYDDFLDITVHSAAMEWRNLEHIDAELAEQELTQLVVGSMGQQKVEANVLLPHRDKASRTFMAWLEVLGLSFAANPTKMSESAKKGGQDDDPLASYMSALKK